MYNSDIFCYFVDTFVRTKGRETMPRGQSLLEKLISSVHHLFDEIEKGTVHVCVFDIIAKNAEQFIKLCTTLFSHKSKRISESVVRGVISQRLDEFSHFTRRKEQIIQFVKLCKISETVKGMFCEINIFLLSQ